MDACSGAHHWARVLQAHGYQLKLIAPQFVKPYVKSNKNDANDAEAIGKRANGPSGASTWHRCSSMRPIYVSSRTSRPDDGLFANEEESIYGRYRLHRGLTGRRHARWEIPGSRNRLAVGWGR
jgi:hypothetical protein